MKKILICSICLFLCGCSSVSLNETQQVQIKQYVNFSNNLIEQLLKNEQPRKRLQPYRSRYRLIDQIIQKKFNN